MELILKSNDEKSLAKIIALAKKLNIIIEKKNAVSKKTAKSDLKDRILDFKAKESSSFGDATEWQKKERSDRELPFS
ncbi:hypothetical protein [Pedobacter chitinilyticus]|uniref:Uncharacterized protein n=1 Tax=Pedobacter chitinilyticus TaxID=2233776 RepID=A0A443YJC9_9SPHI|nr:hypothetical protein [Pedobacter chitinilyticus]RWU03859.1 hypothetical protein DPV69_19420 [Pedobacter chitinilyticus]